MRGTIIKKEGDFYIAYKGIGEEEDSVETRYIKLSVLDKDKVKPGDLVEFECRDNYTISDEPVATIKK